MKLHKCSFCESDRTPTIAINQDDVWSVTARVFCSCGNKVSITIPTNTIVTKDMKDLVLKNHILDVATIAWNSLNH